MSLTKGYNPPGSITVSDICALLDGINKFGIMLSDVDNAYILSKLTQGNVAPTSSSVIVYIENGRLVFGPATAFTGGGGGGGAPDIRPLNNTFTGLNYFNENVVFYKNISMPHLLAGAQISGLVAFDATGRFISVPYQTVAGLLSTPNNWTSTNTFSQNSTNSAQHIIGVPLQINTASMMMPNIARNDLASLFVLTLGANGEVYKTPLTSNSGGGGVLTGADYIWTGFHDFVESVIFRKGLLTPDGAQVSVGGNLVVTQKVRIFSVAENNSPKWALTWNEASQDVERTFLETGALSAVVPCTNITTNYSVTFNASISHTAVPTTSMGDSVIPANTSFTPGVAGRNIKGKLVIPNVKVTASGTAYLHIHVWVNSALVRSYVEPVDALAHGATVDFTFTGVNGANPIIVRYAVEYSSGATAVVTFNETANGKYQPYLLLEELLKS